MIMVRIFINKLQVKINNYTQLIEKCKIKLNKIPFWHFKINYLF